MHEPLWNSALSSETRQQLCVQVQDLPPNTAMRNVPAISTNQKKRKAPSYDGIKYNPTPKHKEWGYKALWLYNRTTFHSHRAAWWP